MQVLDVLGDAVSGDRAAQLLEAAGGSTRRAVNAFFDQTKASSRSYLAQNTMTAPTHAITDLL